MGENCSLGVLLRTDPRESTISCGEVAQNPFKLCDFPLVTLLRLLY